MSRASQDKNYFQFTGGKITEATGLNFPENSLLDEKNIEIDSNGVLKRRRGIDSVTNSLLIDLSTPVATREDEVCTYIWNNPGDTANYSVLAALIGESLFFFNTEEIPDGDLGDGLEETIDLSLQFSTNFEKRPRTGEPQFNMIQVKDRLVVVGKYMYPFVVSYDSSNGFTKEELTIGIRDYRGIAEEGFDRTQYLKKWKLYDLINMGWNGYQMQVTNDNGTTSEGSAYPIAQYNSWTSNDVYPSSKDNFHSYTTGFSFDNALLNMEFSSSGSDVPKGRAIINAFNQERSLDRLQWDSSHPINPDGSGNTSVSDPDIDSVDDTDEGIQYSTPSTDERPHLVEFFQGHVCYAGVTDLGWSDTVFVSQTVSGIENIDKCYSKNDPTRDIESSPLATDGGIISITGINKITGLKELGGNLIVFADNGIWSISSVPNTMFSVNDFSISKITSEGVPSDSSVVSFQGSLFVWGYNAIYQVSVERGMGTPQIQDLTQNTIQEDYNDINDISKSYCTGVLDRNDKKIYWVYDQDNVPSSGFGGEGFKYRYHKGLVLDMRAQGFYSFDLPYENSTNGGGPPVVCGSFYLEDFNSNGGPGVYFPTLNTLPGDTAEAFQLYISSFFDRSFQDWGDTPYESYFETGHEIVGDAMRQKKIDYVFFYFNRTETSFVDNGSGGVEFDYPSSCKVQFKWDWTSTGSANRWSRKEQAYRFTRNYIVGSPGDDFDYDFDVIVTKNRARGNGKSVRIRAESEDGKDFQILGWAAIYSAGAMA